MNTKVTEIPDEVVETPTTPALGVEVQEESASTPEPKSSDAELDAQSIQAQYEEKLSKINADLNAMKSTFQRKEAQTKKEWELREANYKKQLEELKLASMDDEQRKTYEATSAQRRAMELESQLQELEQERQESIAMLQAQTYFLSQGVPQSALNLEEGYDALWSSGLTYLVNELAEYRKGTKKASPAKTEKPVVSAPPVVTTNNAPAQAGVTWDSLKKRLGVTDDEDVYRLFETGQIPADLIPTITGKS